MSYPNADCLYSNAQRPRFLNAKTTLQTLLSPRFNAIPIVNENDTVSVSELRFGDNDTLSAITAGLIDADYLFLLTDVDGLYTGNPRSDPTARRLGVVENVTKVRRLVDVSSAGSNFGTGGMMTKLIAAELATAAGVSTVIINGTMPENIVKVVENGLHYSVKEAADVKVSSTLESSVSSLDWEEEGHTIGFPSLEDPPHTIFLPRLNPLKPGKWSILHALHPAGTIIIDQGALERIARPESGGRLLPAGVIGVEGTWERMQAIRVVARRKRTQNGDAIFTSTIPPAPSKKLNAYLYRGLSSTSTPSTPASRTTTPPLTLEEQASRFTVSDQSELVDHFNTDSTTTEQDWELVEVGRGLANYNSIECERIKGIKR
jgi:glutamate 5-kinase